MITGIWVSTDGYNLAVGYDSGDFFELDGEQITNPDEQPTEWQRVYRRTPDWGTVTSTDEELRKARGQ